MSTDPCEPWCKRPDEVAREDMWVCPVCGAAWDLEARIERIIVWTRENVYPPLTDLQIGFLRSFLQGDV